MDVTIALAVSLGISLVVNIYFYTRDPMLIEFTPEPDPDGIVQTSKHLGRIANRRVALMEFHYFDDKAKRHAWVARKLRLHEANLTDREVDNYIKHAITNVRKLRRWE